MKIAGLSVNGYGKTIAPQLTLCYGFFWTNRLAESLVAAERLLRAQLTVETCRIYIIWIYNEINMRYKQGIKHQKKRYAERV